MILHLMQIIAPTFCAGVEFNPETCVVHRSAPIIISIFGKMTNAEGIMNESLNRGWKVEVIDEYERIEL